MKAWISLNPMVFDRSIVDLLIGGVCSLIQCSETANMKLGCLWPRMRRVDLNVGALADACELRIDFGLGCLAYLLICVVSFERI